MGHCGAVPQTFQALKVLLLANHEASSGRAARLLPQVLDFLRTRLPSLEYAHPTDAAEVRRLAAAAAAAGYDRVFAAGGDGTAHAVVNGLCGTRAALGVIPLGHGNDLARALGIPVDPLAAADFLLRASVGAIDVARIGEDVYAGVAGVGLDAEANRRANTWGPWLSGHARYLLAGLWVLATYRPLRVELASDTESFAGEVMWLVVTNTPNYGGGMRITPRAVLDDGSLDVCIIERMSRPALLRLYPSILRGEHLDAPGVRSFRARHVALCAPADAEFYGDGDFLSRLPVEIRVEPAALHVLRRA